MRDIYRDIHLYVYIYIYIFNIYIYIYVSMYVFVCIYITRIGQADEADDRARSGFWVALLVYNATCLIRPLLLS